MFIIDNNFYSGGANWQNAQKPIYHSVCKLYVDKKSGVTRMVTP